MNHLIERKNIRSFVIDALVGLWLDDMFNHLQLNVFFKDLQFNRLMSCRLIYVAVQRLMKCRKFCICARIIYSFKKRQMDLVLLRDIAHHHETLRFDPVLLSPTRIFYAFFFTYFWF